VHPKTVTPLGADAITASWLWDVERGRFADEASPSTLRVDIDVRLEGGVRALRLDGGAVTITARLLRLLPLGAMEVDARRAFVEAYSDLADFLGALSDDLGMGDVVAALQPALDAFGDGWSPKRSGRRGRPDVDYARAAARYVELVAALAEQPTVELADELALSPTQARSVLAQARARGLLTEAPKGRAGGRLTPKAVELLRGDT
jgi:hypothetical protein